MVATFSPDLGVLARSIGFTTVAFDIRVLREVRQWIRQKLKSDVVEWPYEVRDAAELVACEFVTNAVKHATPQLTMGLSVRSYGLAVEVSDGSSLVPVLRPEVVPLQTHGRGLHVVQTMSQFWNYQLSPGRKCVFAFIKDAEALRNL